MLRRPRRLAALLVGVSFASGCARRHEATVLYLTDAHEIAPVVDRHGDRGGVARLKTVLDGAKRRDPAALAVFGGDLAGGTLFGGVFRGVPMVDALGKAGVGLATFGQHDFDFGAAHAKSLAAGSRFPWFTSNLVAPAGSPFAGLPPRVRRTVGGLSVGFLGLTDDMETTSPDASVAQTDLVAAAREGAGLLRRDGAEAVVALTQAGAATNERILREVPLVDAVLTEEESEERSVVRFVGARPIAAPCGNIGSVIELALRRDGSGTVVAAVRALPVDASVPPDEELARMERRYTAELDAKLAGTVARLAVPLPAFRPGDAEIPLGDLVADAFREAVGGEAALVPGTSLRADLPAGEVTRKHVFGVLPFGSRVVLLEVEGATLRDLLEKSLDRLDARAPLLQVSGLSYAADAGAPRGARLRDVRAGGAPLRDDRRYRVAVSSYLASGGEGFPALARAPRLPLSGGEPLDAEALAAHLARLGRSGAVAPPEAGRIALRVR